MTSLIFARTIQASSMRSIGHPPTWLSLPWIRRRELSSAKINRTPCSEQLRKDLTVPWCSKARVSEFLLRSQTILQWTNFNCSHLWWQSKPSHNNHQKPWTIKATNSQWPAQLAAWSYRSETSKKAAARSTWEILSGKLRALASRKAKCLLRGWTPQTLHQKIS